MTDLLQRADAASGRVRLAAEQVTLAYDDHIVVRDLDLQLLEGSFTAIVGPNGCGKSTLLRALGRLLRPTGGQVLLDGRSIARTPTREVAKVLGLLPQSPIAPDGLSVADLVTRTVLPEALPVGILTAVLGAPYLLWLLVRGRRRFA